MDESWQQSKTLFQHLLGLPVAEREPYLREQKIDQHVREQVQEMLLAHTSRENFLLSPLSDRDQDDSVARDPLIGHAFDQYRICHRLGIGGNGAVYEAQQSLPNRRVAIKILRHDQRVTNIQLDRFRAESEILARLQHPNIAHVYAAGTLRDDEGQRPWFAMELVDGYTLKRHLRLNTIDREDRLKLFLRICEGVSHAHSRDVIHRDLKPANILIPLERPDAPKVVDFGIAKMVASAAPNLTRTGTKSIMGTLDYVSPEQLGVGFAKIDHRCDIYALGVILFELLAEQLPHERSAETLTGLVEQLMREPALSLRQVDRRFPKDLEVIVAKSLAPDPDRRYQSVDAMADDVNCFLRGQPIAARPASMGYRIRKYVVRNRVLVAGSTSTIIALTLGLSASIWNAGLARKSAAEAQYEAEKAVAVSSYITNDFLVKLLNEIRAIKAEEPVDVGALVDTSSDRIDTMFVGNPLLRAAARNEVGTLFYNLGDLEKASVEYAEALRLWDRELGPDHPDTLKATHNLGQTYLASSRAKAPETLDLCQRAFDGRKRILGVNHEATIRSLNNLAQVFVSLDRMAEAEQLLLQGLAAKFESTPQAYTLRSALATNLGLLYISQERIEEALKLHRSSFELAKRHLGLKHPVSIQTGTRLVRTFDGAGRYAEAITTLEPLLNELKRTSTHDPSALLEPLRLQARVYRHQGNLEFAEKTLRLAEKYAVTDTERFDLILRKIKRDLRHLKEQ